ncbi:complex I subunit 1/NuoH family protein [Opitutus terrae]|uniref:NADH-quinone oxidoreductase subunit H n=1 Tax=Opitutus terrae (strain DSM 11246 / JCM 15787 / PB90-1) TaxID=452637 RepID=B1ZRS6_OPITP|nr:complex I subunit 1 family protein [Opitutus terrae]ACB73769.1 NADH dehydrogenase (quinone) [Opitutus terrae PB90-1]
MIADFYFNLHPLIQGLLKGLAVILVIFPIAGICSMAERKVAAWVQDRPGPNRAIVPWIGWIPFLGRFLQRLGLFHVMADGGKMLFKEDSTPGHVNKFYFIAAPILAMIPALTTVTVVPFGAYLDEAGRLIALGLAPVDIGILGVFAVASLSVYSLILAGWASNSKYPFLGSIRASAQLISYELSMTLAVLPVFLWINTPGAEATMGFTRAVEMQSGTFPQLNGLWFGFYMPVSAFIFLVALFAETNRQPFDTIESEADLVGSFHTEYGAFKWGLFFVAEYSHMIVGSAVFMLLFGGGWNPLPWLPLTTLAEWLNLTSHPFLLGVLSIVIFLAKVLAMIFFFMWVRWTLPRFRYDQVMQIGWRKLLPLSIANLIFYAAVIAAKDLQLGLPAYAVIAVATLGFLAFMFRPQKAATI